MHKVSCILSKYLPALASSIIKVMMKDFLWQAITCNHSEMHVLIFKFYCDVSAAESTILVSLQLRPTSSAVAYAHAGVLSALVLTGRS